MRRTSMIACAVFLAACSSSGSSSGPSTPEDGGARGDGSGSSTGSTSGGTGSTSGGTGASGGGGYGAACDTTYTDGCDSVPGPGTSACGEDPTHCCGTRRGCAAGLTCVVATCSIECAQTTDCAALSPVSTCVFPVDTSNLKGCFDPCSDAGTCSGDLVCRPPVGSGPANCQQYVMGL